MTAARRTLVLGGVRSGKSAWAERQLADAPLVDYVATGAERLDDPDWVERVELHRARRPAHWRTLPTLDLPSVLVAADVPMVIDDLGNWVVRTIDDTGGWQHDLQPFRARCSELRAAWEKTAGRVVLVSSEVGSGVHPESRSGRVFADELGRLNTALAATADEVVLIVAGLPLWLRQSEHEGAPA